MTAEQKALRERPEETIAEWDDAASATEQLATDGTLRGTCRRLRAALGELKRLREEKK